MDKPDSQNSTSETPTDPQDETSPENRRQFLRKGLRRAAYVAPMVLLLKPPQAIAGSGGSLITPGP